MSSLRRAGLVLAVCFAPLVGCAEPPNKELSQAQGALDAARAAGAAEYAPGEFDAATEMLAQAHQSVTERDYRAALSHALDSSLRAQAAAKSAVEARVAARAAAEQALGELSATLILVQTHLASAEAKRMPAATRTRAQSVAADAERAITAAREALAKGDAAPPSTLTPHRDALAAVLASLTAPPAPARGRPRR